MLHDAEDMTYKKSDVNFWLISSILCLLMHWLLKSPAHQQAWYWRYMIGNSRVATLWIWFLVLHTVKDIIENMNSSFMIFETIQYAKVSNTDVKISWSLLLHCSYFMTVWAGWRLKSTASPLFTQPFVLAQITENHQSSASLDFVRGIDWWPWIAQKLRYGRVTTFYPFKMM